MTDKMPIGILDEIKAKSKIEYSKVDNIINRVKTKGNLVTQSHNRALDACVRGSRVRIWVRDAPLVEGL